MIYRYPATETKTEALTNCPLCGGKAMKTLVEKLEFAEDERIPRQWAGTLSDWFGERVVRKEDKDGYTVARATDKLTIVVTVYVGE